MKKAVSVVLIVAALAALGAKEAANTIHIKEVGHSILLTGWLGHQLGETVTITGYKKQNARYPDSFFVESVNGEKAKAVIITPGIGRWPEYTKATLQGVEVAEIRFTANVNGQNNQPFTPSQVGYTKFEIEKVIEPANLKLDFTPFTQPPKTKEQIEKGEEIFK